MARPRLCTNLSCQYACRSAAGWLVRDGTYLTGAHGRVQRYRCRGCGHRLSDQSESMHLFAKRRLDLKLIFTRLRGGSSMRDIARSLGCSPKAISNAALRLGRQAMAAHLELLAGVEHSGRLCFDGLLSAVCSRDYPSQITTLGDRESELVLAMTHAVSERGGTRTAVQRARIEERRTVWQPHRGALSRSIALVVHELSRFACGCRLTLDTDEHPLYRPALLADAAIRWYRSTAVFEHRQTPGSAPRTVDNPLFLMNYLDRMIRHRVKEHTRESIAIARNSTMQMHRMWIFAWDHNVVQPRRVAVADTRSRAEVALSATPTLRRLKRQFFTRRVAVRTLVPESMREVWEARLESPPVRWRAGQKTTAVRIAAYARRDLQRAYLHAG
jgi:transposase-like protein